MSTADLLARVESIALRAGRVVMDVYAGDFDTRRKGDASPVTVADERAEALITAELRKLTPGVPIVAEEAVSAGHVPQVSDRFWLVDPLDGTREFVQRNGEFTVNIALIEHGEPTLGVVLAPALDTLYAGAVGGPAYVRDGRGQRPLRCRPVPSDGLTVVASASHGDPAALDEYLRGHRVAARKSMGSSLKLCLVAAGEADLYPRLGRTMEWDIAAGHGVLRAAGGCVTDLDGKPLRYGKAGFENPHFVARGMPAA